MALMLMCMRHWIQALINTNKSCISRVSVNRNGNIILNASSKIHQGLVINARFMLIPPHAKMRRTAGKQWHNNTLSLNLHFTKGVFLIILFIKRCITGDKITTQRPIIYSIKPKFFNTFNPGKESMEFWGKFERIPLTILESLEYEFNSILFPSREISL